MPSIHPSVHSSTDPSVHPQSMKVRAKRSAAVWSRVCSSLLLDICQRSPKRPGRAVVQPASVGRCGLLPPSRMPAPPAPDWRESEGAWDLVVMCFPDFLPNGVFFFFGLTLIQELWGGSCPPSQGRHTCWLHLTPRWGYGFGRVPKPPRGSSLALPFPKGLMGLDCACTGNRHCVPPHDSPGPALLPREPWVNPCAEMSA